MIDIGTLITDFQKYAIQYGYKFKKTGNRYIVYTRKYFFRKEPIGIIVMLPTEIIIKTEDPAFATTINTFQNCSEHKKQIILSSWMEKKT